MDDSARYRGYDLPGTDTPLYYSIHPLQTLKALLRLPALFLFPLNWSRQPEWWLTAALIAAVAGMCMVAVRRSRIREFIFGLGFLALAALPANPLLLIGPDLEKSRVLYLPGVGVALAFGVLLGTVPVIQIAAILVFQLAALEHNLIIRRDVTEQIDRTCNAVASVAVKAREPMLLKDLPRTINGVYFLQNGFHSCIEAAAGQPLPNLYVDSESKGITLPPAREYSWAPALPGFKF